MELKPAMQQSLTGQTRLPGFHGEWEVKILDDLGSTFGGLTGKTKADFGKGAGRYVTFMNVMTNVVVDCNIFDRVKVTPKESQNRVLKGDLLFNGSSETPEEVAMCSVILADVPDLYLNSFCFGFRFREGAKVDGLFLAYYIRSWEGRELMKSIAQGSTRYNLSKVALLKSPLRLPSFPEQTAIATALSDVDALLGGLDQLIAKKCDIKQAAMQQLLTGQTRLPGFHGEWEVKRLGELADMGSGGTPKTTVPAYYDGDIPWVSISDMTKGGKVIAGTDRNLTRAGFSNCAAQMFPVGTVLYAMYASLGECSMAGIPLCSSQAILGIRPHDNLSNDFLYYYLASLKPIVKSLGQQGTQANLNKGMVQDFRLRSPSFPEQTAIAAVLSDMDAELAALETRRDKTRNLKQAMMQELLTGKTRLI